MSQDLILKVSNLAKNFGGVKAVNDVSFELQEGEALGVIGPNGSGKSTLINLITGFVKPSGGRIIYRGENITGLPPYKIVSLGIARSFQMAKPFYNIPVFKNLIIPLYSSRARKLKGGAYGDRDEAAIHFLEDVGFERDSQVPYKAAGALPHGYLKRLELARCLTLEPDLIILDELFSGMSMSEIASILPLLAKIREEGKTLIMVEHRLRELFRVVDKAIVLNFGGKIAEGTSGEVMDNEEVRKAYLGSEVLSGA
ncbi:MAG TPA: ABC transporter ATP-binding protein [Desulfotomaculum sp.]|nr:MAG: ABC transporter [Peptococcaceae bacterium BRH_c8a]KJS70415.1 MAG: ABC transporter [Desulfotomaculum sp. BICA1-6]HBX22070.1 ABC transporter ATP-binding protein [Desulfotomaculum sp.]